MNNKTRIDASFWRNKSVLITGHTGFKGSWLTLWLSQLGARVSGISLAPHTHPNLFTQLNLESSLENHWIADIRHVESITKLVKKCNPQIVIHLAAQPLVRESYKNPLETWSTNVLGSLCILEALRSLEQQCAVVMVTTDKVYLNREWDHGYRETDRLGGKDPYSASKAAAELAIYSWQDSFCGLQAHQHSHLCISVARAGNVIGGGDWSSDRIIPDLVRSLAADIPLRVRNPHSYRPWQHVLDPLSGYLVLAQQLLSNPASSSEAFNFGPSINSNVSVAELVGESLKHWPGTWEVDYASDAPHEASLLHLQTDKAWKRLGWSPKWNFRETVERTILWYLNHNNGIPAVDCCLEDISFYTG